MHFGKVRAIALVVPCVVLLDIQGMRYRSVRRGLNILLGSTDLQDS
jgi:hypothetical protein